VCIRINNMEAQYLIYDDVIEMIFFPSSASKFEKGEISDVLPFKALKTFLEKLFHLQLHLVCAKVPSIKFRDKEKKKRKEKRKEKKRKKKRKEKKRKKKKTSTLQVNLNVKAMLEQLLPLKLPNYPASKRLDPLLHYLSRESKTFRQLLSPPVASLIMKLLWLYLISVFFFFRSLEAERGVS